MTSVDLVESTAIAVRENVARVIVGKDEVIDLLLVALFCEGHVLLEDVPGIGKTTLAKSLARSLGIPFQRIQFTPDLLPSDITGVSVYNRQSDQFEFRPGPIMAGIVLADEINRAGPRTQSALLEAMEERQVTVDGVTHPLPYPFFLIATQNPVELEGTFPLPEAQMDRFLLQLPLGYPEREEERQIVRRFRDSNPLQQLEAQVAGDGIQKAAAACRSIFVHPSLEGYIVDLVRATRDHEDLELGASPRGSLALYRTAQALAALRKRTYVLADDVQELVRPVLRHRLILNADARLHGRLVDEILTAVLAQVPVPVEESWSEVQPAS